MQKAVTKPMEKNILKAFRPNIIERLGEAYPQNGVYREHIRKEEKLLRRLDETLTEDRWI